MTALNEVLVTGRVSPPDWEALGGRGSGDPRPAPPRCRHMGGTPYLPKKNEIRGWRREGPESSSGTGKEPEGPGRCDRRKALGGEGMMSSPSGDSSVIEALPIRSCLLHTPAAQTSPAATFPGSSHLQTQVQVHREHTDQRTVLNPHHRDGSGRKPGGAKLYRTNDPVSSTNGKEGDSTD